MIYWRLMRNLLRWILLFVFLICLGCWLGRRRLRGWRRRWRRARGKVFISLWRCYLVLGLESISGRRKCWRRYWSLRNLRLLSSSFPIGGRAKIQKVKVKRDCRILFKELKIRIVTLHEWMNKIYFYINFNYCEINELNITCIMICRFGFSK